MSEAYCCGWCGIDLPPTYPSQTLCGSCNALHTAAFATKAGLSNSLVDLAARIRIEHDAATIATRRSLEHAMAAGDLLTEAKAQLKHGQWMPWLIEHCSIPDRTVRLYMRLARHRSEIESKLATVADFSLRDAISLLSEASRRDDGDDPEDLPPRPLSDGEIMLPIGEIKFRPDLYPRSRVEQWLVDRYGHFLRELPAIEVNQRHELIDGLHRLKAFEKAKHESVRCRITSVKDNAEHLCIAVRRNSTHGIQLPLEVELDLRDRRRKADSSPMPRATGEAKLANTTGGGWSLHKLNLEELTRSAVVREKIGPCMKTSTNLPITRT